MERLSPVTMAVLLLSGCASVQMTDEGTPPIASSTNDELRSFDQTFSLTVNQVWFQGPKASNNQNCVNVRAQTLRVLNGTAEATWTALNPAMEKLQFIALAHTSGERLRSPPSGSPLRYSWPVLPNATLGPYGHSYGFAMQPPSIDGSAAVAQGVALRLRFNYVGPLALGVHTLGCGY